MIPPAPPVFCPPLPPIPPVAPPIAPLPPIPPVAPPIPPVAPPFPSVALPPELVVVVVAPAPAPPAPVPPFVSPESHPAPPILAHAAKRRQNPRHEKRLTPAELAAKRRRLPGPRGTNSSTFMGPNVPHRLPRVTVCLRHRRIRMFERIWLQATCPLAMTERC